MGADGPVRAAAGMEASTLYAAGSISKDQRLEVYLVQKVRGWPLPAAAATTSGADTSAARFTARR